MKRIIALIIVLITFNQASLNAQNIACLNLAGLDFGGCTMFLGYGIIDGSCTAISGCSTEIDGVDYQEFIFSDPLECEAACSFTCMDLIYLDFGPCDAIIGFGMLDGVCTEISGCGPIINGFDFSPYFSSSSEDCQLACSPICMDLAGINFGQGLAFLGYAMIGGQCTALSGNGPIVNGTDYSLFIYDSQELCESQCSGTCMDLVNIDFGECTMALGITLIDGQCISLSGCGYEVNGVDYEDYFFDNLNDCETSCLPFTEPCVIPEIIDSTFGCFEVYEPVCGCDGETYSNSCYARVYGGVSHWTEGICMTDINEHPLQSIKIYPNPANNLLKIENPEFEELSLKIYDMTGKIIISTQINSSTYLDISYIKQGIYLLQLNTNKGSSKVKKLIIH